MLREFQKLEYIFKIENITIIHITYRPIMLILDFIHSLVYIRQKTTTFRGLHLVQ
jgi:hypothetical protein